MGCGCGKPKAPGTSSSNPLILGANDNSQVQRVRLTQNVAGTPAGVKRWVTGTDVPALLASGALEVI